MTMKQLTFLNDNSNTKEWHLRIVFDIPSGLPGLSMHAYAYIALLSHKACRLETTGIIDHLTDTQFLYTCKRKLYIVLTKINS